MGKFRAFGQQIKKKHLPLFLRYSVGLTCLGLIGCGTIKKAGVVATAAGTAAAAGTALSGGALAPTLGATIATAFVADVVTEVTDKSPTTMAECPAPVTGFWPLMGQVIETGGWLLAAVILVPLIMGYLIPNGLEKKKKR